jgi:2-iminobutanoate/2-iminopropanoate deaminase
MSRAIDADAAPKKAGPYSHAVRSGNLVFCSGQGPFDPATGAIPERFEDQVRQTLRSAPPLPAVRRLRDLIGAELAA